MPKRALAAVLWFAAVWVGYEIVWSLTGVPRLVGPIIAFAVSATVALDPMAVFWPRRDGRVSGPTVRPVSETNVLSH